MTACLGARRGRELGAEVDVDRAGEMPGEVVVLALAAVERPAHVEQDQGAVLLPDLVDQRVERGDVEERGGGRAHAFTCRSTRTRRWSEVGKGWLPVSSLPGSPWRGQYTAEEAICSSRAGST